MGKRPRVTGTLDESSYIRHPRKVEIKQPSLIKRELSKCSRCNHTGHIVNDCFSKVFRASDGTTYPIVDVFAETHLRGDDPNIKYYKIPPGLPNRYGRLRKYDLNAGTVKPLAVRNFKKKI